MFVRKARRAVLALAVAGAAALAVAVITDATRAAVPEPPPTLTAAIDRAPAEFVTWIDSAPLPCPSSSDITREFIAAQLDVESGFDARAVGPVGQAGGAQLLPAAATHLRDDDGNGEASPLDPGDAVYALARLDCEIADQLAAAGKPTDAAAVAAAYNAGIAGMDTEPARAYARLVANRM